MSQATETSAGPDEQILDETRDELVDRCRSKFGAIPSELIVEQALRVTEGTDFTVRVGALDALARRMGFANRDGLVVEEKPVGAFGDYITRRSSGVASGKKRARRRKGEQRPYTTRLEGLAPLRGSCDCADYLRGSLGLCKHLLVVLDYVHRKPRRLHAATTTEVAPREPALRWNPVRPYLGAADPIVGLRLEGHIDQSHATGRAIGSHFDDGELQQGSRKRGRLKGSVLDDLGVRLDLLTNLARAV